jgi:hypothetical protein
MGARRAKEFSYENKQGFSFRFAGNAAGNGLGADGVRRGFPAPPFFLHGSGTA